MSWQQVCTTDDVDEDELEEFEVGDITVLVANAGGDFFAYPPNCPHQETPLSMGMIHGDRLTCMKHLWQWNLRTGEMQDNAESPLLMYEVKVEDGAVLVNLEQELKYDHG